MASAIKIKYILSLIRFKNVLIALAVQLILYFFHVVPYLEAHGLPRSMSNFDLGLFVLCCSLVVGSGNVINDVCDQDADEINKPHKRLIGKVMTEMQAIHIYMIMVLTGAVIALYLSWAHGRLPWFAIYPLSVLFLFVYSKKLSCVPLIGNFMIAWLCSAYFAVVVIVEWSGIELSLLDSEDNTSFWPVFWAFSIFTFLLTFTREIVKDAEDIEGDLDSGCSTMANTMGPRMVRWIIIGLMLVILGLLIPWNQYWGNLFHLTYSGLAIGLPLILMIIVLSRNWSPLVYAKMSTHLKLVMLSGMVYLLLI
jgi:4-hydroxybenzoate polyprenyltransferase